MTKTNKKGKELLDDVNAEWERREMNLTDFKKGAQEFIGQIRGQSTGQQEWSRGDYLAKKQGSWLKKRGIFENDKTATPEQIALRTKKDAAAKKKEAKRVEKRQRGSKTLAKRKMEVPEYLQNMEDLKKYKKGFAILYTFFRYEIEHTNEGQNLIKLKKLGLV